MKMIITIEIPNDTLAATLGNEGMTLAEFKQMAQDDFREMCLQDLPSCAKAKVEIID